MATKQRTSAKQKQILAARKTPAQRINDAAYKRVAKMLDDQAASLFDTDPSLSYDLDIAADALRLVAQHGLPKAMSLSEQKANDQRRYKHIAFIYALLEHWRSKRGRVKKTALAQELGAAVGMSARNMHTMCLRPYYERPAKLIKSNPKLIGLHLDQASQFFKQDPQANSAALFAMIKADLEGRH